MSNPKNTVKFYARPAVMAWLESQSTGKTPAINDALEAFISGEDEHREQQKEVLVILRRIESALISGAVVASSVEVVSNDDEEEDAEVKDLITSMF